MLNQLFLLLQKQGLGRMVVLCSVARGSVVQHIIGAVCFVLLRFTKHIFRFAHGQYCVSRLSL